MLNKTLNGGGLINASYLDVCLAIGNWVPNNLSKRNSYTKTM